MNGTKSLIESKTFWGALLALVSVVAAAFNQAGLAHWAGDPDTLNNILAVAGVAGSVLAMYGRKSATTQVTSVLPASQSPK